MILLLPRLRRLGAIGWLVCWVSLTSLPATLGRVIQDEEVEEEVEMECFMAENGRKICGEVGQGLAREEEGSCSATQDGVCIPKRQKKKPGVQWDALGVKKITDEVATECFTDENGRKMCGDVEQNPLYVTKHPLCVDRLGTETCQALARKDGCIADFPTMRRDCKETCRICHSEYLTVEDVQQYRGKMRLPRLFSQEFPQEITGDDRVELFRYFQDVEHYMYDTVYMDEEYAETRTQCQNRHELCTFWASLGECEKNPKYMTTSCPPACFACDKLLFKNRCPYDAEAPTFLKPGDLDTLFERIMTDPELAKYSPKALTRPNPPQNSSNAGDESEEGPWIVVLENFLTEEECEILIKLGADRGYQRSMDVGDKKFDGTYDSHKSEDRTSSNAWCVEECWEDPTNTLVHDRLEHLTGVPRENYEYLQMLRYEEGQHYGEHHDYIEYHSERAQGVRSLTVFLYLNDVEEGGGTHFTRVNKTVQPKTGRAVIWPSVLNEDPNKKDSRTMHEALPVEKGIKFGANAWLHQRDFKTPWAIGCS